MQKILLTGGRNPMTLELVRLLDASGMTVYLTDSIGMAFARYSRYVAKYFYLPHVSDHPELYIQHLIKIIEKHQIDVLLPTNEEVFYIAQFADVLTDKCDVLCDKFSNLKKLHHKHEMLKTLAGCGMNLPETHLIETAEDINLFKPKSRQYLFKPAYSRFADKVLIKPAAELLDTVKLSPANPYVAQEYIEGTELCSFSIAAKGKLTAHVTYQHLYKMGRGSGIYNTKIADQVIERFCQLVCSTLQYHGQIGFDYLVDRKGDYFVVDCNPRTTGGIHFFHPEDRIVQAFFGDNHEIIRGSADPNQMNGLTLFVLHGIRSLCTGQFAVFQDHFSKAQDVIFRQEDPKPFFGQLLTLLEFFLLSVRRRIPFQEAFYTGNAWNGQWERKKIDKS